MDNNLICVLVKPNELPVKVALDLDSFSTSLECDNEDINDYCPFQKAPNICLLYDDNAKKKDKLVNRAIYADEDLGFFQKGQIIDIICGSFIVSKTNNNGEFVSLNDNEVSLYSDLFKSMDIDKRYTPISEQERLKEPVALGLEYSFSR